MPAEEQREEEPPPAGPEPEITRRAAAPYFSFTIFFISMRNPDPDPAKFGAPFYDSRNEDEESRFWNIFGRQSLPAEISPGLEA
jgi:hypothetical protein